VTASWASQTSEASCHDKDASCHDKDAIVLFVVASVHESVEISAVLLAILEVLVAV
jgi:hypothetical protein